MAVEREKIVIVGCGPGAPDYVTPAARRAVEDAEVVLGSRRLLGLFPDVSAQRIELPPHVQRALSMIEEHDGRSKLAVLVSGDPGLFSLARGIVQHFGIEDCTIVPAVSSLQIAFARLGLDWSGTHILSAHGKMPAISAEELAHADKIAVFAGTRQATDWVADVTRRIEMSHALFACENLTLPDERIRRIPCSQLSGLIVPALTVFVLVRRTLLSGIGQKERLEGE